MTATTPASAARNTIGARLARIKKGFFVGRAHECDMFAQALAGMGEWEILNPFGPGGVGKSSLLDAYRRIAEQTGALYLYFDARELTDSPDSMLSRLNTALVAAGFQGNQDEAYLSVLHRISTERRIAIVFDTYEDIGALDSWLRDMFLPQLPERTVVVIAGRFSLNEWWRDHDAWGELIRPMHLDSFDLEHTREFLNHHGVTDADLVTLAQEFTGGHPLALSLAAALVKQEGPAAFREAPQRPEIISALTQRWLREMPDQGLREQVEAASIVRHFDQDLLGQLSGTAVPLHEFKLLTRLSFVRRSRRGWALHDLLRAAVARELQWRRPNAYQTMRLNALRYFAHRATTPGEAEERKTALQEFFYLLGNGLVRAALFGAPELSLSDLRMTPATPQDLPALQAYMDEWRQLRGADNSVQLELMDHDTQARFKELVVSEPREPDFLNMGELLALDSGVIRLMKSPDGSLRGLSVVLPVNRHTLDYLLSQPVTRHYFRQLDPSTLASYATPREQTACWFVRLIDVRDPADIAGRAVLLRDLVTLLIRPALFITSTPLPLYQDLLQRFGFTRGEDAPHFDFAEDRPSHTFMLDLRGPRLAAHLSHLLSEQTGLREAGGLDDRLAGAVAAELSSWTSIQQRPVHTPPGTDHPDHWLNKLTPREQEVVHAALDGAANCTIADRLSISEITVKKHMSRIFEKVGVRNRAQLIKHFWAVRAEQGPGSPPA